MPQKIFIRKHVWYDLVSASREIAMNEAEDSYYGLAAKDVYNLLIGLLLVLYSLEGMICVV
jgi:hypothetical protein